MNAAVRATQAIPRGAGSGARGLPGLLDPWLLGLWLAILCLGLVMVASASSSISERAFASPLYYFWRQGVAVLLGMGLALGALCLPLRQLARHGTGALLLAVLLLVLVLVPGLGREVNGAMRWVSLGPVSLQASEFAKLLLVIYVASYLVRHAEHARQDLLGFFKPVGLVALIAALLLLEPDFGATVVLFATTLGMLFLGGISITRFCAWSLVAVAGLAALATLAPYRLQRLMTFLDPWADPYDSGFQLTQALIAFGRGEWFGVGLGASVQKAHYLPEVHTDFIFAVIGEELGAVGALAVIALYALLLWRAFHTGAGAERQGQRFGALLAYGIGLLIGIQAFFNIGVNMGVLPTKGLTLPFISYGANSMLVNCAALGLLLRVAFEARDPARWGGEGPGRAD